MTTPDKENSNFTAAAGFINNTSRHIFLTGKAGTGKTTFLKFIREQCNKRTIVVAPTGVAAINAGGTTMHSFFQLPLGPYIPGNKRGFDTRNDGGSNNNISDRHSLFSNMRISNEKKELMQELELLIIDEISMVRADMLDCIDAVLRHFRRNHYQPFGGVQVLFIGDMYQLPPVVPDNEWEILKEWYDSPFFFSAKAIQESPPLYIELKKIYRQKDQVFIDLLNRVRNNQLLDADYDLLNRYYQPGFRPNNNEKYIILTSHNRRADAINNEELAKLPGNTAVFEGIITGDFPEKALPTEINLQLKEGAQVMFIKNDSGADRKYFNGKLATVKKIGRDEIIVIGNDNNEELKIEKETWKNIRYNYKRESESIEEEELGSFSQFPLRLAWSITIHKSQGLTFNKAVIDAAASFAPGQVYVALSRCTSLEGIVLLSKLLPGSINTDERVIAFARQEIDANELEAILNIEKRQFLSASLIKAFDKSRIIEAMENFCNYVPGKKLPDKEAALALANHLLEKIREQSAVAEKFSVQLKAVLRQAIQTGNVDVLHERTDKAIDYFGNAMIEQLIKPLQTHLDAIKYATKTRGYTNYVKNLLLLLKQQLRKLVSISYDDIPLCKDASRFAIYYEISNDKTLIDSNFESHRKKQPPKGSSQAESLALFKSGKTIKAIAATRALAETTITGHLTSFIVTGDLAAGELLSNEKIAAILQVIDETGTESLKTIKEKMSDDYSYSDIRIVVNHLQWLHNKKVNA